MDPKRLQPSSDGFGSVLGLFAGTFNVLPGAANRVASHVHAQER
jgi:hypothetical protein